MMPEEYQARAVRLPDSQDKLWQAEGAQFSAYELLAGPKRAVAMAVLAKAAVLTVVAAVEQKHSHCYDPLAAPEPMGVMAAAEQAYDPLAAPKQAGVMAVAAAEQKHSHCTVDY